MRSSAEGRVRKETRIPFDKNNTVIKVIYAYSHIAFQTYYFYKKHTISKGIVGTHTWAYQLGNTNEPSCSKVYPNVVYSISVI